MSARPPHDLLGAMEPELAIAKLIPIGISTIGTTSVQTTNARDLHAFLEIGKDFSTWVKTQISRARLVDGRDFVSSPSRGSSGQHIIEYHLTLDAGKHIGMLSETEKGFEVREYYLQCERRALAPARSLSPAEMFLQNAQAMVDMERRQLAHEEKIDRVEQRMEEIAEGQIFTVCPSNAEPITVITARINKQYGLPAWVIEQVVRQSPFSPKPAGPVLNTHESAKGSKYWVYWVKDISAVFRVFVSECKRTTTHRAKHPFVDGEFKLAPGFGQEGCD